MMRASWKFAGSESHEAQDAETFAAWGFDLLKYDLCSYEAKFLTGPHDPAVRIPYERMGRILLTLDRDVVYSMCQYGYADAWEWARGAGGNTWRTTDDLGDDRGGGLRSGLRDLWRQRDLGFFDQETRMSVGEHGAELVRLQKR
jgi:alpha-galactosidase